MNVYIKYFEVIYNESAMSMANYYLSTPITD